MDSTRAHDVVPPDGDVFERNITALRRSQPALAARVQQTPIPNGVERVVGRDGVPNFIVSGQDGRRTWFGATSMPTISAPALVSGAEPVAGNILLPAIAAGREATLLAEKVGAHGAVFVYDRELLSLRLALTLCDVSAWIDAGRLVLLTGDDVEAALVAFFEENPGYEFIGRILAPSGVGPARVAAVKQATESAARTVVARQDAAAQRIGVALRSRRTFSLGGTPRTAILSVDARPEVLCRVHRIEDTARSLGWPVAGCLPDSPARCHGVARLAAIRDHEADLVLTVNSLAGKIEPLVNERQPLVSWFDPTGQVKAALVEGAAKRGLHLVATAFQRSQLLEAGVGEERVDILEVGADTLIFRPLDAGHPDVEPLKCDVAVVGDITDLGPQAGHVSAESHIRLFDTLVRSSRTWADAYAPDKAPAILVEAERRSDRALKDEQIREMFVRLIRQVIAPAVLSRMTVERLAKSGLRIAVWGSGWSLPGPLRAVHRGPVPSLEKCNAIFNAARIVLCPFFDATASRTIVEVLAAGGRTLFRYPDHDLEANHPQLAGVLRMLPSYRRLVDVDRAVSSALRAAEAPGSPSGKARQEVLAGHTLAHRLESLRRRAQATFG